MRMKAPKEGSFDPIAPLELPHSLHAFHRVSQKDKLNVVSLHFHYLYLLNAPFHFSYTLFASSTSINDVICGNK